MFANSSVPDGDDAQPAEGEHRPPARGLVPEHVLRWLHQPRSPRLTVQLPALYRGVRRSHIWLDDNMELFCTNLFQVHCEVSYFNL